MEQGIIKVCKNSSHVADLDDKGRVKVAANAFFNEDADGDISMPGSFTKTLSENMSRIKWFLNHDRTKLLGVPIEGSQSEKYLEMVGQLNMKKDIGRDAYEDYKLYAEHGRSLEHSVMVQAIKRDKEDGRRVLEWKMWEYSTLTSWGANPETPLLGIKSEKSMNDAIEFMELCLRKGNYTDARGREMEQLIKRMRTLSEKPLDGTLEDQPGVDANFIKNLKLV